MEALLQVMAQSLLKYFKFIDLILSKLVPKISLEIENESSQTIDERLAKIEIAKNNLMDSIKAIEELKAEAEKNKIEANLALNKLLQFKAEKEQAEKELSLVKTIAESDISTFKKIAGIPDNKEKNRDRLIGFVSGIFASLIASGLIYFGISIYKSYGG